jgi:threonine synthase
VAESPRIARSCSAIRPRAPRPSCAGKSSKIPRRSRRRYASATLRHGSSPSTRSANRAAGGWFAECTDEEILHVQKLLARTEGIFCEPASAIALAGVLKDLEQGRIGEGSTIVCTLTGHGLKDPDTAIAQCVKPPTVDAELGEIERLIRSALEPDAVDEPVSR